jgi:SAM-dependent methyltransferase
VSEVFGPPYAGAYDEIYRDKDYARECEIIESIFAGYARSPVKSILDLGCGTGSHALPLARGGYDVLGVDRSPAMVERAREKAAGSRVEFQVGELATLRLGRTFDAALMLFAVLGYQQRNADVRRALETARRHVAPGGLFVCDVWYGPAVLRQRPSERIKVIQTEQGEIHRATSGELDVRRHLCHVHYRLWRPGVGSETAERHTMRYFFPLELELHLELAGFSLERLGAFPDFEKEADESTWNVFAIARAV